MSQPDQPVIPDELWMLWITDPADSGWVLSFDDAPQGQTFLVAFDENKATEAAKHQHNLYDLDCVPVRVKSGAHA